MPEEPANLVQWARTLRAKRSRVLVDGVLRSATADETLSRLRRHAGSLGVTREANVTGLDFIGIPVFMICRPNSRGLAVSQGKGLTAAAARVSGLMECLEAAHAECPDLEVRYATRRELATRGPVIEPSLLEQLGPGQVSDDTPLLWVQGWDLLQEEATHVPFEMVHTDYSMPRPACSGYFRCSSDGLGAGNDALEAVLQGALELIERSVVDGWLNRRDHTSGNRIDLGSIADPSLAGLLASIQASGARVALWALPGELGFPVALCRIHSLENSCWPVGIAGEGTGCGFSRSVAVRRAILEAAQSRLTIIAGTRDDIFEFQHRQLSSISEQVFKFVMDEDRAEVSFSSLPDVATDTLEAGLDVLLHSLSQRGQRHVIVVPLQRQHKDYAVVRVLIPGLA